MSDLVLSLIDERLQRLAEGKAAIEHDEMMLQKEREKLVRLKKGAEAPAKASKPKAASRKAAGGPTVKEKILAHMRDAGEPVTMAKLAEAIGAKSTTINGTLHAMKKARLVMNSADGWAIAPPSSAGNGGPSAASYD